MRTSPGTLLLVGLLTLMPLGGCAFTGHHEPAPTVAEKTPFEVSGIPPLSDDTSSDTQTQMPVNGTYRPARWDEAAKGACTKRAESALDAYLDKGKPTQQWFEDLRPHLTPDAAAAYAGTDPTGIVPAEFDPGTSKIVTPTDSTHLYSADVQVNTDQGVFGVRLSRVGGNDWLVSRIVMPGEGRP